MNYATSSGIQTATAQITTQPGGVIGIDILPPGTGVSTLTLYDSNAASTSALVLGEFLVPAGVSSASIHCVVPTAVNSGIYAVFAAGDSASTYIVRFMLG